MKRIDWSKLPYFLDNPVARLSIFFTAVGYLVLANDWVAKKLTFKILTGENTDHSAQLYLGLSSDSRLRLIYFGLCLLALARTIYLLRRPWVFAHGLTKLDFVSNREAATSVRSINEVIEQIPLDDERSFESYQNVRKVQDLANVDNRDSRQNQLLKDNYRITLESLFEMQNAERPSWFLACATVTGFGYVLLAVPALDIFFRVVQSTLLAF